MGKEAVHTMSDLYQMQALPLNLKIRLTEDRIRAWLNQYDAYVSFSGGKDSTVLLDICRKIDPQIPAVFSDTGLEYPEIRDFVKTFDNVTWVRPKMQFKKVIEKYGYPFIGKETSLYISEMQAPQTGKNKATYNLRMFGIRSDGKKVNSGKIPEKYKFLINAPFKISNKCCDVMKKSPMHKFSKENQIMPITAQMADESRMRMTKWLQNGCNAFDSKNPISNPMSFWTEQDVLQYIKLYGNDMLEARKKQFFESNPQLDMIETIKANPQWNFPICSVYGDIIEDEEIDGQINIVDLGMNPVQKINLKTTGCDRTGCMFCGYGCHLEKKGEGRFERMKETHPKQYEWIMKPWNEGGLGYKDVIDWINEHGNLNIRY